MTVPSTYCTLHSKDGRQRASLSGVLYTVYSTQYKVHLIQYTPPAIQTAWLNNNVSNAGITRSAVKASQLEKSTQSILKDFIVKGNMSSSSKFINKSSIKTFMDGIYRLLVCWPLVQLSTEPYFRCIAMTTCALSF